MRASGEVDEVKSENDPAEMLDAAARLVELGAKAAATSQGVPVPGGP